MKRLSSPFSKQPINTDCINLTSLFNMIDFSPSIRGGDGVRECRVLTPEARRDGELRSNFLSWDLWDSPCPRKTLPGEAGTDTHALQLCS